MGTTRTERAVDEFDFEADAFENTCDDIRLAWLAKDLGDASTGGTDFDALWSDR